MVSGNETGEVKMSPYSYQLRHDQNGRIIEKQETVAGKSVTWKYAYDKEGRLFEAHLDGRLICQCYYDRQGRRMRDYFPATAGPSYRDYQYTMDNRLLRAGNNTYTHDDNGFRSICSNGGTYHLYEYAPDYRLLKMEVEDQNRVYTFHHDEDGQRAAKYLNGQLAEAYQWLDFIRLGAFHDGRMGYEFGYAEGERLPSAMRREDDAVFTLHYDQIGSVRVVADAHGNVIKEVLYDPFGGIIEDTNPGLCVPIGFAGGLHDRDLGFVRFGWRDYDTFTSRWTAPDPIGDKGGDPDWYGYCLDDPVNGVDPLGLMGLFQGLMNLFSPDDANAASLTTDMKTGKTTFDPRPEIPDGKPTTIETHNKVTRSSKKGANNPYKTGDVQVIKTMPKNLQKSYGPDGAYIDTGDSRGRDIHGGGGKTREDAIKPQQGWRPTNGCTRGQNEDVINLGKEILEFQRKFPGVKIPYERK
jgi:RHS repeat-associated protein